MYKSNVQKLKDLMSTADLNLFTQTLNPNY